MPRQKMAAGARCTRKTSDPRPPAIPTGSADSEVVRPPPEAQCPDLALSQLKAQAEAAELARRDSLILEYLPLAKAIAAHVHASLPVHVEMDDLVHAGVLGLLSAAAKFDSEKQVSFPSYARHRIKGAILDSLRQLDWASRDMRRRHKQVETAMLELASVLERAPTEEEIAKKLGIDVTRFRQIMIDVGKICVLSSSNRASESEDSPAPDFPSKKETQPDFICAQSQLRGVLEVATGTLPARHQKVVSLYYRNEMTMKEISVMLGINESRVSQIHKAALQRMACSLEAKGVTSSQAF